MKKTWNAPSIETLDVRMTESGALELPEEGKLIFQPEYGTPVILGEGGPKS